MRKTLLGLFALAVLIAGPITAMNGCAAEDIVPVRTPEPVQEHFNVPPNLSFRQAGQRQEIIGAEMQLALKHWGENRQAMAPWVGILNGLQTAGADILTNPNTFSAGGGVAAILAAFAAGAFGIKRPGDKTADEARRIEHEAWDEATATVKGGTA